MSTPVCQQQNIQPTTQQQTTTTQPMRTLNIDRYLSITNYNPTGNALKLKDNTEFYASGSPKSKHGVIIIPDFLGWNSGRVRNICDFFGDHDCFCVIPNFSSRGVEGEAVGYMESSGLMDWYKSRTFDGNLKPVIFSIVNFMKNEGIDKISLLGYSWGAWVVVSLLASELSEEFVCGVLPHPSLDLEEKMYGGSLPELMCKVNRPILLMPTSGDPEIYKSFMKLLKYKVPTSNVIDYSDIEHGFLVRGNSDYENIRCAIQKCLNDTFSFFNQHFNMEVSDLVRECDTLGPEAVSKQKTFGQTMKEGYENVKEHVGEKGEQLGEKTKQTGQWIGDKSQVQGENIKQTARDEKEQR